MGAFDDLFAQSDAPSGAAARRADLIQENTSAQERAQFSGSTRPFDDLFAAPASPGVDVTAQPPAGTRVSAIPAGDNQQAYGTRQEESFFDRASKEGKYLGSSLERGWNNIKMSVNGMKMSEFGDLIQR